MTDIEKATDFLATHARVLDRRRGEIALHGAGDPEPVLAALAAYRNADGGFGWGLEPDLRLATSQPGGALHAFEVHEEIAPATSPLATDLCDWLAATSLPGGGLPFAINAASAGTAPWWAAGAATVPSVHITAAVAGTAHRVARHDRGVREHEWLAAATSFCMEEVPKLDDSSHALARLYVLRFLDAVHAHEPRAGMELERLTAGLPPAGIHVTGGADDEFVRPVDIAPEPGGMLRDLLDPEGVRADLDRLAGAQRDDGGWEVDFPPSSPQGGLEWRGYATVRALRTLIANDRLDAALVRAG